MSTALEFANECVQLVAAWQRFKQDHDIASQKMTCCEITREFYKRMDAFEASLLETGATEQ